MAKFGCTACGEELTEKTAIWLELDFTTGKFHKLGEVPEENSQGWFTFGRNCARKILKGNEPNVHPGN